MVVEHTLHIVVLPGLHWHAQQAPSNASDAGSAVVPRSDSTVSLREHASTPTSARLRYPEHSFWPPSPFHLVLPIITRLSFNEAGKITHHRDFWDVKVWTYQTPLRPARGAWGGGQDPPTDKFLYVFQDLLGLVPGMTLVQWVTGRLAAQGIRGVVRAGRAFFRSPPRDEEAAPALIAPPPPSKSAGSSSRTDVAIAPQ